MKEDTQEKAVPKQKKTVNELIRYVEEKYPVEDVTVNGIQLWPFYKIFLFDLIYVPDGTKVRLTLSQKVKLILSLFYGWRNWFRPASFIGFSNSDQRKLLQGKMVDKSIDYILGQLQNTWLIELPVFEHYPQNSLPTDKISSVLPMRILETILTKVKYSSLSIEREDVLQDIGKELGVSVDAHSVASRLLAQKDVMGKLIAWKKPKAVFMVVPYMKMGYVLACRQKGIPVVEMQHGVINENHFPYFHLKSFDKQLFPDKLISYGTHEQEFFEHGSTLFNKDQIYPAGHYYLDSLTRSSAQDAIRQLFSAKGFTVALSMQGDAIGSQLPDFIKKVALRMPDVGFLICPRNKSPEFYAPYDFPDNVKINRFGTIYDAIAATHVHGTVFSTCALEAPALGRRNLMINLGGKSKEYFGDVLRPGKVNAYIDTVEECINELLRMKKESVEEDWIKRENKHNIIPEYKKNIDQFVNAFLS